MKKLMIEGLIIFTIYEVYKHRHYIRAIFPLNVEVVKEEK